MADTNKDMNKTNEQGSSKTSNETMQREQGSFDKERQEKGGFDKDRQEKGAIGGGDKQAEKGQSSGQSGQFDKNRSEPTSR